MFRTNTSFARGREREREPQVAALEYTAVAANEGTAVAEFAGVVVALGGDGGGGGIAKGS